MTQNLGLDTPTLLIPAAGFGKRMGHPHAKEILPDEQGKPMIDWILDYAQKMNLRTVVITRHEKQLLINHIKQRNQDNLVIAKIQESIEWPHSILLAREHWGKSNIVVLPDTRFEPIEILQEMSLLLSQNAAHVWALFELSDTDDLSTWGTLNPVNKSHIEKPLHADTQSKPWGLFGFTHTVGERLLNQLLQSTLEKKSFPLPTPFEIVTLRSFIDLTRPK